MKKAFLLILLTAIVLAGFTKIPADLNLGKDVRIVLLKPTGNFIDEYPEMKLFADTSIEYQQVFEIIEKSAVKEILEIYFISQAYLYNLGINDAIEPAYLALTENQGGYAKKGFFLLSSDSNHLDFTSTQYVDIMLKRLLSNYTGLMSFTQLFPHELAHVIYSNISLNDSVDPEYRNVDMHYFAVITDYNTAFNEGFAEQMENISRIIEANIDIRTDIQGDLDKIEKRSGLRIQGYINDFKYPFRLGYYKSSVIYWFQKYEDYRRHEEALDASIKYLHTSPDLKNIEDRLSIRNAGIMRSDKIRNPVQAMATEGVVSSFFTHIIQSNLPSIYRDTLFYKQFLSDTNSLSSAPEDIFTPLQNQFIKYFYVMHNYVSKWNSDKVQLAEFINGYILSFPEEEKAIRDIYREVSGREFDYALPPQLWLLVKDHDHRFLAIDPFGAVTIPVYTFDLNAAEEEDLLTIKGLTKEEAREIISYRDREGLYSGLEDIKQLKGLSDNAISVIMDSKFDGVYLNSLDEPILSFSAIISTPIWNLVYRIISYLIVLLLILNIFLLARKKLKIKTKVLISLKYFSLWIFLSLLSFAIVLFLPHPLLSVLITCVGLIILTLIWYYRSKEKLTRSLVMSVLMGLILIASII